jgi:hypothetical protein
LISDNPGGRVENLILSFVLGRKEEIMEQDRFFRIIYLLEIEWAMV